MRNYGQEYLNYGTITYPTGATASGTSFVKSGAGQLGGIMVTAVGNTPTLRVVDNSVGTVTGGTDIFASFTPVAGTMYKFSGLVAFTNGLYISSTGSVGLTVAYI